MAKPLPIPTGNQANRTIPDPRITFICSRAAIHPHIPGWVPAAWNDISDVSGYILNDSGGVERDIFGVVEVVPEPSAFALFALTGACLLKWKRSPAKV
jgi:hypothetical protein